MLIYEHEVRVIEESHDPNEFPEYRQVDKTDGVGGRC